MRTQEIFNFIANRFAALSINLEILNKNGLTDLNKISEKLVCQVLNITFGYDLQIFRKSNQKAVDLIDERGRIAVQVTSRTDLTKVKKTISDYQETEFKKRGYKLLIVTLGQKKKAYRKNKILDFDLSTDLIDIFDLTQEIFFLDPAEIREVYKILEYEVGELYKIIDEWRIPGSSEATKISRPQELKPEGLWDRDARLIAFNSGLNISYLLELPNGKLGIIGSGYDCLKTNTPNACSYIERKLKTEKGYRLTEIEFVILPALDLDNLKGMNDFLSWIRNSGMRVKNIVFPDFNDLSSMIDDYLRKIVSQGVDLKEYFHSNLLMADAGRARLEFQNHILFLSQDQQTNIFSTSGPNFNLVGDENFSLHLFQRFEKKAIQASQLSEFLNILLEGLTSDNPNSRRQIEQNNQNPSMLIQIGSYSIYFGLESDLRNQEGFVEELSLLDYSINAEIVIPSHFGSKRASSDQLWQYIFPSKSKILTILNATKKNPYGYPHSETLRSLEDASKERDSHLEILRTDAEILGLIKSDLFELWIDENMSVIDELASVRIINSKHTEEKKEIAATIITLGAIEHKVCHHPAIYFDPFL